MIFFEMNSSSLLVGMAVALMGTMTTAATPPTPAEIRSEVTAMRQLMDGLRIEANVSDRGYTSEAMDALLDTFACTVWESKDGCFRTMTSTYRVPRQLGDAPAYVITELFDGTDSHRSFAQSNNGLPVVAVTPGLDSLLFKSEGYFNYATLVWADLQCPLDELMNLGVHSASVAPQPVDVRGVSTWCLTLRQGMPDTQDMAAWVTELWVAPSYGMMPVRTRISWLMRDGSTKLINGRNAYDFAEVRPGLFLPRTVIVADPFDPHPATFKRFDVTSFGQSRAAEELAGGIFAGDRYVLDYRHNQQYELRDGVRSKVTTVAAAELESKLKKYAAQADGVREASQKSAPPAPSWSSGRIAAWSVPAFAGLGILLWSFRAGRVRA